MRGGFNHESQLRERRFSGEYLSNPTRNRLIMRSKAPIHCMGVRVSPSHKTARATVTNISPKPRIAVWRPPRCFTPMNKVIREMNVVKAIPMIGHQDKLAGGI